MLGKDINSAALPADAGVTGRRGGLSVCWCASLGSDRGPHARVIKCHCSSLKWLNKVIEWMSVVMQTINGGGVWVRGGRTGHLVNWPGRDTHSVSGRELLAYCMRLPA